MYGALASGPRSSLRKIRYKKKFASEQHKKQADLKDIGAFLLIFSHPAFFASRLCRSDAKFNAHFISHNYCAVHYYIRSWGPVRRTFLSETASTL